MPGFTVRLLSLGNFSFLLAILLEFVNTHKRESKKFPLGSTSSEICICATKLLTDDNIKQRGPMPALYLWDVTQM